MGLTHAYAGDIITKGRSDSGDLIVEGIATNDALDLDGDRCDPAWLKSAMPAWMKWGNIREQHSNIAAGVGLELAEDGNDWHLKALITDPGTAHKFETGTLKGWSVGIKNARTQVRNDTRWIVGGDIVEISGVDRPCNPTAVAGIAKSIGGEWESAEASESPSESPEVDSTQERQEALTKALEGLEKASKARLPNEQPDIDGANAAIKTICDLIVSEAKELAKGRAEEACDIKILMEAVDALQCFAQRETAQGSGTADSGVTTVMLNVEPGETKAEGSDSRDGGSSNTPETDVAKSVEADISKRSDIQDIVKSAVIEATKAQEETIKSLRADLAEMKATPIPGGPVLIAPPVAEKTQSINKAASFRAIADDAKDPSIQAAYRALAEKCERDSAK